MWSKPVAAAAYLWFLLAATARFQPSSAVQDATHEDIRTAIYSFAHTLRDNVDKLERHERREKQSGDQMQNMLLTIVNKQREQFADHKALEMAVKSLENSMNSLTNAETEGTADRAKTKSVLDDLTKNVASAEVALTSTLKAEQQSTSQLHRSLDGKLTELLDRLDVLQNRFDAMEQTASRSRDTEQLALKTVQELLDRGSATTPPPVPAAGPASATNATAQLVQEMGHAVLEAVAALSGRLDEIERKRDASAAVAEAAEESTRAFRDDVQNSFRLMSAEVKTLSDVEKVLVQTADNVLDTKRRIEYSTHQILMEVTAVVNDRSRELNGTVDAALERATKTVLDAQTSVMANLSVKIETEISQVWRQIGIMYQTLTNSASTLDALKRQTDVFVNGTAAAVDGMDNKVSAIAGRMSEVDENLNYLLGRLSLVTQEFKEIKIGLGEALESIRVGLQTVQGNKTTAVDLGPGPNPIDDEPLSNDNLQNGLSKTIYTVT